MTRPVKPNRFLTECEREEKQKQKSQLKRQKHKLYWEGRVRFAVHSKDPVKEKLAREQLELHSKGEEQSEILEDVRSGHSHRIIADPFAVGVKTPGALLIEAVFEHLQAHDPNAGRGLESETALLKHMRKGTQTRAMFRDPHSLWEYTRSKFFDRAMLVVKSLSKLKPTNACEETNEYAKLCRMRRSLCEVQSACSIGCGPGNDAVGLIAFLANFGTDAAEGAPLNYLLLTDFAMPDWKKVVDELVKYLVPRHICRVDMCEADVSEDLAHPFTSEVMRQRVPSIDLFTVSFVLTETHGRWEGFITDIISKARSGALFYFAEPRVWQLQHLIQIPLVDEVLEYCWLDSSFLNSSLQPLGTRIGPAVLVGRKK